MRTAVRAALVQIRRDDAIQSAIQPKKTHIQQAQAQSGRPSTILASSEDSHDTTRLYRHSHWRAIRKTRVP